jgi:hypothetical protein
MEDKIKDSKKDNPESAETALDGIIGTIGIALAFYGLYKLFSKKTESGDSSADRRESEFIDIITGGRIL